MIINKYPRFGGGISFYTPILQVNVLGLRLSTDLQRREIEFLRKGHNLIRNPTFTDFGPKWAEVRKGTAESATLR